MFESFIDGLDDEKMLEDFDRWFLPIAAIGFVLAMGVIFGYAWAVLALSS